MSTILESKGLLLRRLKSSDAEFILKLFNTRDFLTYIGDRAIHSISDASIYIDGIEKANGVFPFSMHGIELKSTQNLVGIAGFLKRDYLDFPDLGYALLPEFYSRGFAHEICNSLITFAKEKLKLRKINAIVQAENFPSIRLLEKLLFSYEKEIKIPSGEKLILYSADLKE